MPSMAKKLITVPPGCERCRWCRLPCRAPVARKPRRYKGGRPPMPLHKECKAERRRSRVLRAVHRFRKAA